VANSNDGSATMAALLCEAGCDLSLQDAEGWNPLHSLVRNGRVIHAVDS